MPYSFRAIDHFVLATAQPEAMKTFYQKLGFTVTEEHGRWALTAGSFKINLHPMDTDLVPRAAKPEAGTADFCLSIETRLTMDAVAEDLKGRGLFPVLGPVARHGAQGDMTSVYFRDPDGNLVELAVYPPRA